MVGEPPDYFEPETGSVLTHLRIVRDVGILDEMGRR
jgi:hypothetical protein